MTHVKLNREIQVDGMEIDYNCVESVLCQGKVRCQEWLKKALED